MDSPSPPKGLLAGERGVLTPREAPNGRDCLPPPPPPPLPRQEFEDPRAYGFLVFSFLGWMVQEPQPQSA